MANRSRDWFAQAERDFAQAKASQAEGRHEWACFAAQQAAEMAVKALHLSLGQRVWGCAIAPLLEHIPQHGLDLIEKARVLDDFSAATRDVGQRTQGPPFARYGMEHGDQAIRYAVEIVEFVRSRLSSLSPIELPNP